jgi:hypothetical protein
MKWTRLGLGAVGALVAGGALTFAVLSHGGTASADSPTGAVSRIQEILAQKLGISVDALTNAEKATRDQYADELVAAGKITQAQADKIKSSGLKGLLGGIAHLGARRAAAGVKVEVDVARVTANVSHIDLATVKSELQSGKSFAQIASEHGVGRDALKQAITSTEKTQLQTAVTNGKLTQAQADNIAQRLAANLDSLIDRAGMGRHMNGLHRTMPHVTPTP